MGRFLNADGLFQTGDGILDKNMYAYCMNNPVNFVDEMGNFAVTASAALISGLKVILSLTATAVSLATIGEVVQYMSEKPSSGSKKKKTNTTSKSKTVEKSNKTTKPGTNDNTSSRLPKEGKPNSEQVLKNPDGSIKQRRFYGPDGKATKDIDYNH